MKQKSEQLPKSALQPKYKKGQIIFYSDWEEHGQLTQVIAIRATESALTRFEKPTL